MSYFFKMCPVDSKKQDLNSNPGDTHLFRSNKNCDLQVNIAQLVTGKSESAACRRTDYTSKIDYAAGSTPLVVTQ